MKYFDLYTSYPYHTIAAAWNSRSSGAIKTPFLADASTKCERELHARFAACYAQLRALPRSARRAVQRRIARSSELAAILPEHLQQGGRRVQHRMAWSVAGAALLLALGQGVATAATITVTTSNPNIAVDGQCSLIEAIINANNDAATHVDCPAGSGADTIALPASATVTLTNVSDDTYGPTGLPLITSRITIEGNGATIARQMGAPDFGLIAVGRTSRIQLVGGHLTLQSVTLSGGTGFGGSRNLGNLSIKDSIISGNTGSGVSNSGTLTMENSTVSGNTSNLSGGGIDNWGNATATIKNSTISGNMADSGGGIYNIGSLTIANSSITGNHANHGGGVNNSWFCDWFSACYTMGVTTLNNSLIAGNEAVVGHEIQNDGAVTADNFNLFGSNGNSGVSGFAPGPTDIVPAVPLAQILGPLQNNGGPTQTHALVAGSPAIDAGDPGGCRNNLGVLLLTDQQGFARHVDGNNDAMIRCDIGASEFGAEFVPVPPGPLAIGVTTPATGEAGVSFTSDLMISGGVPPYIVSLIRGALPAGLSLGNDGIISGTISPRARGGRITVRITDSVNDSVTKSFRITVLKALNISGQARTGRVGGNYRASLRRTGGLGPFNWSITAGVLPMDLSLNTATGAITGIPTQAGAFPLTVQVTDALGGVDTANLTLTIR